MSEKKDQGAAQMEPALPPAPALPVVISSPAPGASVTSTAATAMTTAGSGAWVIWIFQCIEAGHLTQPSNECALFMAAALLPIGQTLQKGINAVLGRWFKVSPS